jgi:hypothetical protein
MSESERAAIVFRGSSEHRPGDVKKAMATRQQFANLALTLTEQFGRTAMLDGLMSLYLDLSLSMFGIEVTDKTFREIRRDLPRMMAALRAARAERAEGELH